MWSRCVRRWGSREGASKPSLIVRTPVRTKRALCPWSLLRLRGMETTDVVSYKELNDAVRAFLKRPYSERARAALLRQITSHPLSGGKKFQNLATQVRRHPEGPYKALRGLPTSHYFDMAKDVTSIETRFREAEARRALRTVRERMLADDRYEHLAKRLEYAIAVNAKRRPRTAREREQRRKTMGLQEVLPRGLGPTNFQRMNKQVPDPPKGRWRKPVNGGLPNV